ncbi:MAG: PilC/PilY family type IV pilus protein [Thermodesulfobacteriota bacterium]|nr:PilC/PilY family type IV pilus protein [Thermodesulfobacteriota bacterium]
MKKFFLMIFSLALFIPFQVYAQDDLFQVKTPNVMIIFDTSDSMNMSVNVNAQGNSVWTNKFGPDTVTQYVKDGNHPDSKLYQAKNALAQIINEVVKDRVNLGFSTYAQQKIERRRGQYTREGIVTQEEGWRRYKRYYLWDTTNDNNGNARTATSTSSNSFIDAWGITRSNVTAHPSTGTEFTRAISIHDKSGPLHPTRTGGTFLSPTFATLKAYTITLRVTNRTLNPETNVYTFTYTAVSPVYDRYREAWSYDLSTLTTWSTTPVVCGDDKINDPFPSTISIASGTYKGDWKTYFKDEPEYTTPTNGRTLLGAEGQKWWNCSVQYRAKITQDQFTWSTTTGTSCAATVAGTPVWNLVPGTCFDWSGYEYLADGTVNKPHTWAYHKITAGKWKKSDQPDPFYPATAGDPGVNPNNFFFINFPDDKDSNFKTSDRTVIKNKILSFLDLTPVKFPKGSIPTGSGVSEGYWTKLPIQAIDGKTGLTGNTAAAVTQRQTPLADSLNWAFTYFDDYINEYNGGDPSSKEKFGETLCRGNYIILLTDGLESCELKGNPLVPDYNAAVTESATLLTKNVKTFVIGFGGDIVGNQTLTNIAVAGGTDKAYFAANFNELKAALTSIFQAITGQYYGRSNPVVSRARDRLYRGNFDIRDGDWLGHLMAWDADKQTGVLAPDFAWDSGEEITKAGRGVVYTWVDAGLNPVMKEFKVSESSLYPFVNPLNEDIDGDLDVDNDDAKTVINFTLLPEYDSGKYKGKRALNVDISGTSYPSWKLGDIYHSTPVVIGEPAFLFKDNDYTAFYNANKNREMMIYVGTNDGMLHGFKNSDGREVFSIIPKNLLGELKNMRSTHDFYVDSSPKAYDVYFMSESKWKTVLISGQRGGGAYYFAVDVTKPNDPKILWELTHGNMGDTWAKPDIGKIKDGGDTKFAAFLPGGYSTTDNKGNSFYIVDIETGTILKNFTVGDATNKIPSSVTAFDADEDGYIDYIYFGDIQGTLWKVDVRSSNKNDWTLYEFFKPVNPKLRPIFYSPAVVKNNEGKILVFFGSGNELGLTTLTTNYFYEIEDEGATGKESWSKTLEDGEKVLASPAVLNYVVYFTTWVYKSSGEFCGAGEGRLWGLKVSKLGEKGGGAGLVTLDTDTGKWKAPQEYISLGAGIPSAPVVTNGMVYIGTSLNANRVIQVPIPPQAVARIKSWREVVR